MLNPAELESPDIPQRMAETLKRNSTTSPLNNYRSSPHSICAASTW
jgi:hypothetical protein